MERDFQKLRVGGASASLVDAIQVDHQGRRARLVEMANVTIPDPRQIVIQPWDPNSLRSIGAAISPSRIGLTPSLDGSRDRPLRPRDHRGAPPELVTLVHKRMDQARVEIRAIRHEALTSLRAPKPERHVAADEVQRQSGQLQRLTDRFVAEIDRFGRIKEDGVLRL